MKKFPFYLILALTFVMTTASTCSHDDDDLSNVNITPPSNSQAVTTVAASGNWRVTYYFDTDHEDTANFTNYIFTFGPNNVLTATNGTNTYTGSWSVTGSTFDDNSHNGDDDNFLHFNIGFAAPDNFEELSDDWHIISNTANKIELKDVSGGNGGTDLLTFERN